MILLADYRAWACFFGMNMKHQIHQMSRMIFYIFVLFFMFHWILSSLFPLSVAAAFAGSLRFLIDCGKSLYFFTTREIVHFPSYVMHPIHLSNSVSIDTNAICTYHSLWHGVYYFEVASSFAALSSHSLNVIIYGIVLQMRKLNINLLKMDHEMKMDLKESSSSSKVPVNSDDSQ